MPLRKDFASIDCGVEVLDTKPRHQALTENVIYLLRKPEKINLRERPLELKIRVDVSQRRVRVGVAHQFKGLREDVRLSTGVVVEVLLAKVHVEVEIPDGEITRTMS